MNEQKSMPRMGLVRAVRERIAAGAYSGPAVLRDTVARMDMRGALGGLPGRTRAQLLAERQRAERQGDAATVAEIDDHLDNNFVL